MKGTSSTTRNGDLDLFPKLGLQRRQRLVEYIINFHIEKRRRKDVCLYMKLFC